MHTEGGAMSETNRLRVLFPEPPRPVPPLTSLLTLSVIECGAYASTQPVDDQTGSHSCLVYAEDMQVSLLLIFANYPQYLLFANKSSGNLPTLIISFISSADGAMQVVQDPLASTAFARISRGGPNPTSAIRKIFESVVRPVLV